MMRGAILTGAVVVVAAVTGCGDAQPDGRALFVRACGACHSVSGADDPRQQGGDLRHLQATRAQLLQFAREMPVSHPLNAVQLDAVAAYLRRVELVDR